MKRLLVLLSAFVMMAYSLQAKDIPASSAMETKLDSCFAWIYQDTINSPNSGFILFAEGSGLAPYTYSWSTGETTAQITVLDTIEYCVTITDANGCVATACVTPIFFPSCGVNLGLVLTNTGGLLTAYSYGAAPFSYIWSTGEPGQQIALTQAGTYCVTVVDASGCEASTCYYYDGPVNNDSCWVYIYADSIPQPNGGAQLWTFGNGTAPFSYQWSNGATTSAIYVIDEGTYCVTVTDAVGCVAYACYDYYNGGWPDSCYAWIEPLPTSGGETLCAYSSGPADYTYLWSTGETTFIITATQAGDYCVTVVDASGCEASTCYYYDGSVNNDSCWVYIYADSTQQPNGGTQLWAFGNGIGPFTSYQWSNGATTPNIYVIDEGTYCVTATDAVGCVAYACYNYYNGGWPDSCYAWIEPLPTSGGETLCAYSSGPANYTYLWSTGETTFIITATQAGTYCVTVVDANGCEASSCYYYDGTGNNPDSCFVYIYQDSQSNSGATLFVQNWGGVPPYTYQWSTGETTSNIWVSNTGTYCVTATDAVGCEAYACYDYYNGGWPDSCAVYIYADTSGAAWTYLIAEAYPSNPNTVFSYLWSTGDTNAMIQVSNSGIYCVTVTNDNGCEASACFDFVSSTPSNYSVCGYVFPSDSILIGNTTVNLYRLENGATTLVGTQNFQGEAFGWSYLFSDLPDGDYIVRAEIDAGALGAGDFAPTYSYSTLMWDQAEVYTIPNTLIYCTAHIVLIPETGGNINGNGQINGNVYDMNGGMGGITILLLDEFGNIIAHATTDANGNYSFGNLPLGSYQVMVEMPGMNHANYWVNLTADKPVEDGKDFEINNGQISTGIANLAPAGSWKTFPNPASDYWYLQVDENWGSQLEIRLFGVDGKTVQSWKGVATDGVITLEVDGLQTGLYFYQLSDGHQTISGKMAKQ